jgi:hypothetical protein
LGGDRESCKRIELLYSLTDNTLLPNQNRFALSVKNLILGEDNSLGEGKRSLVVELVWFPLDYFPPRERPTDYGKFSSMLNRKVDG